MLLRFQYLNQIKLKKFTVYQVMLEHPALAENISIDINNFETVYEFLKKNNIDLLLLVLKIHL